ncbi:MAG: prepilin-type N-terminal cleavage/methylation domain-containing protein [Chthoniobacterales bacterium]|nr:prepilin-type N-terminal cleavage/methylation domain-containing protein [Chthoniobacterales bacterium]
MNKKSFNKIYKGFTLVEVLLTTAILLIVIAGVTSLYIENKKNEMSVKDISNINGVLLQVLREIYESPEKFLVLQSTTNGQYFVWVQCRSESGEVIALKPDTPDPIKEGYLLVQMSNPEVKTSQGNNSHNLALCNYKKAYEVHIVSQYTSWNSAMSYPNKSLKVIVIPVSSTSGSNLMIASKSIVISVPITKSAGFYNN